MIADEVFELIKLKHQKSNGSNGYYFVTLRNELNCDDDYLKVILNELNRLNKIIVRDGINGKLIMVR